MLFGVWLIYFSFGLIAAAMAPLVTPIVTELDLSLSAMGGILGAWPLVYIAAAIPAGAFVDRVGLRWSLFASAVLIAVSGGLRALAWDHASLFMAVAVFGVGGPLVSVGAPKLISQWFDIKDRGMAMGIYITGPAIGGIMALALTNSVLMPLTGESWRSVLWIYAAVTLLCGVVWVAIASRPAARRTERGGVTTVASQLQVFGQLARIRPIQIVLLMSVGIFFFNHGLNNWLPEILRSGGMDAVAAGYWAAVPTVVGIAGSLLIPKYAIPARRVAILMVLFACAATATLLIQAGSPAVLGTGLVLQGIARSAMMPIAVLLIMDAPQVGSQNMGSASGLFFTAAEVGGVLGPLTIGYVADQTGGFSAALYVLTGVCLVLAVLCGVYRRLNISRGQSR